MHDVLRRRNLPPLRININGHCIEQVSNFIIDEDAVMYNLLHKVEEDVGIPLPEASIKCLVKLYKVLVLPMLDYCSAVKDPQFKVHQIALELASSPGLLLLLAQGKI